MNLSEIYKFLYQNLQNSSQDFELEAKILIKSICKIDEIDFITNPEMKINHLQIEDLKLALKRRLNKEPISYITEKKNFYGYDFYINKHCLIPRFDSEILIESILNQIKNTDYLSSKETLKITDICTGSGCLGISLAFEIKKINLGIKIDLNLVDVSENALSVAKKNQETILENLAKTNFTKLNIIQEEWENSIEKSDIIISNPPYIPSYEIEKLEDQVKNFEPKIALDGGHDGLLFYRILSEQCSNFMNKDGYLAIEIGAGKTNDVKKIFQDSNQYQLTEVKKDLNNIERTMIFQRIQI